MRSLVPIVTSFTVAHSVTLIASAFDMAPSALWFPPLINTLVAVSILYMAFENIAGARLSRRWLMTFAFGLVHGFAFAFAFKQTLQFAGTHLFGSLIAFNVGLEIGQLLLLVPDGSGAQSAVQVRHCRAPRHGDPVRARCAHGLALDLGALRRAGAVSIHLAGR